MKGLLEWNSVGPMTLNNNGIYTNKWDKIQLFFIMINSFLRGESKVSTSSQNIGTWKLMSVNIHVAHALLAYHTIYIL